MTRSGCVSRSDAGSLNCAAGGVLVDKALLMAVYIADFSVVIIGAVLSLNKPRKTPWRMRPVLVHSAKETSASKVGLTQCGLPATDGLPVDDEVKGDAGIAIF